MPTRPELHRATEPELMVHRTKRPSAAIRSYNRAWQRRSRWYLSRHPLCADPFNVHGESIEPATQVDHIVSRAAGGGDEDSNLQSLCASCHSRKTMLFDGGCGRAKTTYSRSN